MLFFLTLVFVPFTINAQQLQLNLFGSLSKETGPDFDNFNWGFATGGEAFFYLGDHILLGGHIMYNRWAPDESEFTETINDLISGNVEGDAFIVELVPSLRLTTRFPMSSFNLFTQTGAGLYIINDKITVNGTNSLDSALQKTFGENTRGRFGFNIGGGISLGNLEMITLNLFPMFNMILLGEGETVRYLTFNIGISLNL